MSNRYSVPWSVSGRVVRVQETPTSELRFWLGERQVARRDLVTDKGRVIVLPGHPGVATTTRGQSWPSAAPASRTNGPDPTAKRPSSRRRGGTVSPAITPATVVCEQLEHLGLTVAANALDGYAQQAARENRGPTEFLAALMGEEQTARRERTIQARMQLAHLPYRKTLDQFDFAAQPGVDERRVRELAHLRFLANGDNVLLLGPPGVGKTHLAIGLAIAAISAGHTAYFITAAGAAAPTSPPEPAYPSSWPEFDAMFPDDAACRRYLEALRWPDGFACMTCGPAKAYRVRANAMKCARWTRVAHRATRSVRCADPAAARPSAPPSVRVSRRGWLGDGGSYCDRED